MRIKESSENMLDYKVKIGLVPMRRNTTNRPAKTFLTWVSAEERGRRFLDYIENNFKTENVSFIDSRGLGCADLIFDSQSAADIVKRFKEEKADAVMIINCNFGNEDAAAELAQALDKPVLLWAPLDDEYYQDGMRPTDSQCGLFGVSRQLQRFHIPFSHLPCCRVDSDEFKEGFDSFTRVVCMVKNFQNMRIGQIGIRPAPFYSIIWNEGELMEKFGLRIIPFNMADIQNRFYETAEECKAEIAAFEEYINKNYLMDDLTPQYANRMATLAVTYKRLFDENRLDIASAECWTATPQMFNGLVPCAVYGILNDLGYIFSCESDIHCAITMLLLSCASFGKNKPFLGEFTVRHPENKNAELLWHCGPFPLSVKASDSIARLVNQREWFRAKDGEYTVARIDQENGNYMLLPLKCHTTIGPQTHGTYIWGEFDNLQAVENRLLDGPYIHHFCEIEGDYRKELREFCKYIPNLKADTSLD